jgi:hypothetical protein
MGSNTRYVLLLLFIYLANSAYSQPWPGYNTSRYAGMHSLPYQPEIHSVMPSDWDINVMSANLTFFNENFFGIDPMQEISDGNVSSISDISKNRTGFVNAIIQFPSVAYRINEKSTVGFSWRLRAVMVSNASSDGLSNFIHDLDDPGGSPVSFNNDFARGVIGTWGSYGFIYSRELINKKRHRLYGGLSFNLISGAGSAYLDISNASFSYSQDTLTNLDLTFTMAVTEEIDKLVKDDEIPLFSKFGLGVDFGLNYVKTSGKDDDEAYDYKFGIGVVGLGRINYNTSQASRVHVRANNVLKSSFTGIESFRQLMDTLVANFNVNSESREEIATRLPLDINLYGDVRLNDRFYLHVSYSRQIIYFGKEKFDDFSFNQFYIVPRYESEKIGVYLPFTYNKFLNLESGIAFRWKPLVIGTSNIFSYLIQGGESTNLDLYFTTRIMINRKKK